MTGERRQRLNARTLAHAHAWRLPGYERGGTPVITHLGFGAFARAHVAVYCDDLLQRGTPALIRGVSLRSRRAQDQLEPQDGLFTVAVRDPGAASTLQVVGALASMESGPPAALAAMTAPTTRLVTLTITENGYQRRCRRRAGVRCAAVVCTGIDSPGVGPTATRRAVASRLCFARQPARQRNRPAGAGPRRGRADRRCAGGVDRPQRAVPELRRRPHGPRSDRSRPGGDRRELGLTDKAAVAAERHRSWIIRSVEGLDLLRRRRRGAGR